MVKAKKDISHFQSNVISQLLIHVMHFLKSLYDGKICQKDPSQFQSNGLKIHYRYMCDKLHWFYTLSLIHVCSCLFLFTGLEE